MPRTYSFSSINTYNQCPRRFHEQYVLKRWKDAGSEASRRGDIIHKELEEFLLGKREARPTLEPQGGLLDKLKAIGAKPEMKVAVDAELRPTGFWSADARLRGKLDVVVEAGGNILTVDWKTGKKRDNSLQADVYHTLLRGAYPQARVIRIVFDYLEKGRQPPYQPGKEAVMRVTETMDQIDRAKAFPPRPSPLCRGYCPVRSCEYNEDRP